MHFRSHLIARRGIPVLNSSAMISVTEAVGIVSDKTSLLGSEPVPLTEALGRVLAEDILADSDLPPFDRSQMDGYALRAEDVATAPARLRVVGESVAGRGWHQKLEAGNTVRIMTGAPVPEGADSVQQVELTRELDGGWGNRQPVSVGRSIGRRNQVRRGCAACRRSN